MYNLIDHPEMLSRVEGNSDPAREAQAILDQYTTSNLISRQQRCSSVVFKFTMTNIFCSSTSCLVFSIIFLKMLDSCRYNVYSNPSAPVAESNLKIYLVLKHILI